MRVAVIGSGRFADHPEAGPCNISMAIFVGTGVPDGPFRRAQA